METVTNKVERLRVKAELFLEEDTRCFIKTYSNDYYFCDILLVGENYITVWNFKGKRMGEKTRLMWLDIDEVKEYEEEKQWE